MRRQKILFTAIATFFCTIIFLCGCKGNTSSTAIEYGNSNIYSKGDIEEAANIVKDKFTEFDGCVLYSLTYVGDEESNDNLEYCNGDYGTYSECIVFNSSFRSPIFGGDGWVKNFKYDCWKWYVAREEGGMWKLITYGE